MAYNIVIGLNNRSNWLGDSLKNILQSVSRSFNFVGRREECERLSFLPIRDRNPLDGTHGTFDGVFGGVDINFYGDLNLFTWANLRDYEWDLHLQPARAMKLFMEHHYFTLDQARDALYTTGLSALRRDPAGLSGRTLGHEINLRFSWQPANGLEILTGWGHFFPGNYVKATGTAKPASGCFLQISYGL
jgi:hypothetical protein